VTFTAEQRNLVCRHAITNLPHQHQNILATDSVQMHRPAFSPPPSGDTEGRAPSAAPRTSRLQEFRTLERQDGMRRIPVANWMLRAISTGTGGLAPPIFTPTTGRLDDPLRGIHRAFPPIWVRNSRPELKSASVEMPL